jgi:hypothetical protein
MISETAFNMVQVSQKSKISFGQESKPTTHKNNPKHFKKTTLSLSQPA